ncbi:MAG: FKBP-type peptidyl-prolyl cis-trans isomerase [Alistipes sp.]
MKKIVVLLLCAVMLSAACSRSGGSVKPKTDTDSLAYVIGMNVGLNLLKMDSTLNVNALCEGIRDLYEGTPRISVADGKTFYLTYVNYAAAEKVRAYEEQFLEDIFKSNRSYARTESGVTYTVESIGNEQQTPSNDWDTVAVRYVIRTADEKEIYSSYTKKDTLRTALSNLLPGLRESVKLIGKGGKILAWLPAATAYGTKGDKKLGIKPNATLYYEIELVAVKKNDMTSMREKTIHEF